MACSRGTLLASSPRAASRPRGGAGETRADGRPQACTWLSWPATGASRAWLIWLFGLALASMLYLSGVAHGSVHRQSASYDVWPDVVAVLQVPTSTDDDVLRAARSDVLSRRLGDREAVVALGHFLAVAVLDPWIRIEARRAAALLQRFRADLDTPATFWSEFSLATLQQLAGEEVQVAETLQRALDHAASDQVPVVTVMRTLGILAHAQQAGGLSFQAETNFLRLRENPDERDHAIVHLGELALTGAGVGVALEIWLSHPRGLTVAASVIVDEADALWARDPETSYRLVDEAMARLQALSAASGGPGLERAIARLAARTKSNAMAGELRSRPSAARSVP